MLREPVQYDLPSGCGGCLVCCVEGFIPVCSDDAWVALQLWALCLPSLQDVVSLVKGGMMWKVCRDDVEFASHSCVKSCSDACFACVNVRDDICVKGDACTSPLRRPLFCKDRPFVLSVTVQAFHFGRDLLKKPHCWLAQLRVIA